MAVAVSSEDGRGLEVRPIPGEEGYFAREDGQILSARQGGRMKVLSQSRVKGYLSTSLMRPGKKAGTRAYVAALVCAAFHGPRPFPEAQARHLDGDKDHNRPGNLRWGTAQENSDDKRGHGTMPTPETSGRSVARRAEDDPAVVPVGAPVPVVFVRGRKPRLTDAQVGEMRELEAKHVSHLELARIYNCSAGYVSQLCRGTARGAAGGRLRSNRNRKVTPEAIAEMRAKKAAGRTVASLAGEYGLSREHAGRLLRASPVRGAQESGAAPA